MKIKSLNFLIGPFMVLLSASCPAIAEPNQQLLEVAHVVHKQYPHAKIITSSFCNLGEAKLAAFGLVIETVNNQSDDPLQPIIAVKQNNQWKLNRLSKSIDYSGGMDRDFLSDFSSPTRAKARQQLVVRCVIPQSDYQINIQSNGEFTNDYFLKQKHLANHLCFPASSVYNNWVCASIKLGEIKPIISFVQMNAD